MTTFERFRDRNRDMQDTNERGVYGDIEYVDGAGAVMKVRGTGTIDEEAPVFNTGYGFKLAKDSNAEVMMVPLGSDTNNKYAVPSLPRDKQRQWKEGTGGVQHPTDAARALEFNGKRTWLDDGNYAFGNGGQIELKDGTIYIRGNVIVEGVMTVNQRVVTPTVVPGTAPVPGFEP